MFVNFSYSARGRLLAVLGSAHSHQRRRLTVLAVESSADDTCAAVVGSNRKILSNVVIKQLDL